MNGLCSTLGLPLYHIHLVQLRKHTFTTWWSVFPWLRVAGSGSEGVDTQGMLDFDLASDEEESMPSIFLPSSRGSKSHAVHSQSPASFLRCPSDMISVMSDIEAPGTCCVYVVLWCLPLCPDVTLCGIFHCALMWWFCGVLHFVLMRLVVLWHLPFCSIWPSVVVLWRPPFCSDLTLCGVFRFALMWPFVVLWHLPLCPDVTLCGIFRCALMWPFVVDSQQTVRNIKCWTCVPQM